MKHIYVRTLENRQNRIPVYYLYCDTAAENVKAFEPHVRRHFSDFIPFQLLRACSFNLYWPSRKSGGYAVEQLVEALRYKLGGRWFDSR